MDVGSANALVIYREAMGLENMSIVEFKQKIVLGLVGSRIEGVPSNPPAVKHELIKSVRRYRCAYCGLFSRFKRTRFICAAECCQIPLCSIGSNDSNSDCFALTHGNPEIYKAVKEKSEAMKTTTNKSLP
jgi:hypothetical protein